MMPDAAISTKIFNIDSLRNEVSYGKMSLFILDVFFHGESFGIDGSPVSRTVG